MSKIRDIAARLKMESQIVVATKVLEMVEADKSMLLQLNKQQLFENKDSNNKSLGLYASVPYAHKKGRLTVDLNLTGDFYAGFFIETKEFPVVFGSHDFKSPWLVKRYGQDIFGLSQDSLNVYIQGNFKRRFAAYFRALLHV
jgi:hypothetical protein